MKKIAAISLMFVFCAFAFGQTKETVTIKVYFLASTNIETFEDCAKVRAVTRTIPKTKSVAKAALEELFKGPTEKEKKDGLSSVFFEDTKSILLGIKIKKGAAYVNLDGLVIEKLGSATTSCGGAGYDASVEKTLKQFPTIKKIFFAIDGDPAIYYNWMQIGECPKELKNCSGKDF
jgi:spore germination protein GerM